MALHEDRQHATWSASATARHMFCPGSLALSLSLPRGARVEREAAAWGTCAHQIAEQCLRRDLDAQVFLGEPVTCGRFTFTVDEEMANTVQTYLDYCRELVDRLDAAGRRPAEWWIEEQLPLDKLDPPFDAGGTGDFIAHLPHERRLEIVDLKGGKGVVVDAAENAQVRAYALGAMLVHPGLDVDRVTTTIVQPRIAHGDGIIRSETFHVVDLAEWAGELVKGMHHAKAALDGLAKAQGNQVLLDEWRDEFLRPGKCQFCPAEGVCPALRNDARSIIDKWFDPETNEPLPNAVLDTSPEALAADLDLMDGLTNWMNARRAYAQQFVEGGGVIPGYQLVDKRGTRRWTEDNETKAAGQIAKALKLDPADLFVSKLKSPAQVEKLIPSTAKRRLEPFWQMVVSGTNLVRSDKTTRSPVGNLAQRFFEQPGS